MTKRIMVVDDEPDFTFSIKVGLETMGDYEVLEETRAENALDAAAAFRPDLILLDIMMPDLDGSEVAASIRQDPRTREVPVVFMTALVSQKEVRHGSCTSGGNIFLPKPLDVEKLIECIEDITEAAGAKSKPPVKAPTPATAR